MTSWCGSFRAEVLRAPLRGSDPADVTFPQGIQNILRTYSGDRNSSPEPNTKLPPHWHFLDAPVLRDGPIANTVAEATKIRARRAMLVPPGVAHTVVAAYPEGKIGLAGKAMLKLDQECNITFVEDRRHT